MKKQLSILAVVAAIAFACGGAGDASSGGQQAAAPSGPDGKDIYRKNCNVCHGLQGDMGATGAFNLKVSELSLDERIAVVTNGRGVMTPFKDILSPEEIKAVAQYTFELKK